MRRDGWMKNELVPGRRWGRLFSVSHNYYQNLMLIQGLWRLWKRIE
ncbi:MAG: hypothetical protein GX640_18210 [Fibrobacter sp.]|nr:hypothetical protein [Fibrobacter sp.]